MTKEELRQIILDCLNEVIFTYNGQDSGITSEVQDYIPTFQVWHGNDFKYYSDVDELMSDKFYSGKSINDLLTMIEFSIL